MRFRYQTFVWTFALGNAVVWFSIAYGLGLLLHRFFAGSDGLAPGTALTAFAVALVIASVLASQGAIVNLRAQYLAGRFEPPAPGSAPFPSNPWIASLQWALPVAAALASIAAGVLLLGARQPLTSATSARLLGTLCATATVALALTAADREFKRFHFHLGQVRRRAGSVGAYVGARFALPWGSVNAVINGLLAWMQYRPGPHHASALVSLVELRLDLTLMTFLISVFMALATIPEVDGDFAAGVTPLENDLPAMPRLWTRYALAAAFGAATWTLVSVTAAVTGIDAVSLRTAVVLKALAAGLVAACASAQCARWALARCWAQVKASGSPGGRAPNLVAATRAGSGR